jgi:hypothetical protein
MSDDKNEVTEVEETLDLPEVGDGEVDTTDWKVEAQKLRDKAIAQRERTKSLKQQLREAEAKVVAAVVPKQTQNPSKADGLDENALDFLDLKGITESEDVKVIEDIVKKTGMTVRQALKDEYVTAKLNANKATREVKAATPSSTKRSSSGSSNDLSTAIAKYEQSGFNPAELPQDFALRSAVINAIEARTTDNKPAWH